MNHQLKYTMVKVIVPSFGGSSQISASAWLQKLSVYFQLNPMVEEDALKMTILHLEGEALVIGGSMGLELWDMIRFYLMRVSPMH